MSSRTFRKGWPLLAAVVGAAVVVAMSGGGPAVAGTDCWYGEITLSSPPLLSAPDPAHVGDTITSSGGGWTTCGGEAINGFRKEWLRDGTVISGPDWVDGWPGSFTYTIQAADIGHELRSAVSPCDDDFGCYTPPAQSSNAVVPVGSPPPPPPPPPPSPPPPPEQLVFDEGYTYTETDGMGNVQFQQSGDGLPEGAYVISMDGKIGVYGEDEAKPLMEVILGPPETTQASGDADQSGRIRCHNLDKYKTAHDSIVIWDIVWRFHQFVHWCTNYPDIISDSLRIDSFFTDVDSQFEVVWEDHGTGWWYRWRGSDTGGHYSRRQGRIDNCILRWGCIGSHYPQKEIWVNGNGAWAAR